MKPLIKKLIPNPILKLLKTHYGIISYLFFGICATVINISTFYIFFDIIHLSNITSNIIAWIIAASFAFITNKFFVFSSKSTDKSTITKEISAFFIARASTGLLDLLIMFVAIDLAHQPSLIWKTISNILVIILNYLASRLFIFKNSKTTL